MKLIDIDRIEGLESHIHYIRIYKGSAIFMGIKSEIYRFDIKFSLEHKPLGPPEVKISFLEHPHFPVAALVKKMKDKILDLSTNGVLESYNKD